MSVPLAQYCSTLVVGSLPVFTCTTGIVMLLGVPLALPHGFFCRASICEAVSTADFNGPLTDTGVLPNVANWTVEKRRNPAPNRRSHVGVRFLINTLRRGQREIFGKSVWIG